MKKTLFFILIFTVAACNQEKQSYKSPVVTVTPNLQVYNGTNLGFYSMYGEFFNGVTANYGTSAPLVSLRTLGTLYLGGSCAASSCDQLTLVDQKNRKFKNNSESLSQSAITTNGSAGFVGADSSNGNVYVVDNTNLFFTIFKGSSGNYYNSTLGASTFNMTSLATASSAAGVGAYAGRVSVSDYTLEKLHTFDGLTGTFISSLDLSTQCSGGFLGTVYVPESMSRLFILCSMPATDKIIIADHSGTPASLGVHNLTYSGINITSFTGITFNTISNQLIISGSAQVIALNSSTGVGVAGIDLSSCDVTANISDVTYDSGSNTVFASDSVNSMIYRLDGTTLALKTGVCATSQFSVLGTVPNPTRLSFY
jgi:hypothetical protein